MKTKSLLLVVVMMLWAAGFSFGAFPVRHSSKIYTSFTTEESAKTITTTSKSVKTSWLSEHIQHVFHPFDKYLFPEHRRNNTLGILSLIFGIVGLFPLYGLIFSIPAIILGAIGMHHDERFSVTGLILGLSAIVLLIAEIIALAFIIAASL